MALAKPAVLIVDDEANIRLMLRTTLEASGYRVLEANGGVEAIKVITTKMPRVVVLDLNMPEFDGMQLLGALRDDPHGPKPHVIVLTAHASVPTVVRALRLGASDFIEKPVAPEDLRISVASLMQEQRTSGLIDDHLGQRELLNHVRRELQRQNLSAAEELLEKADEAGKSNSEYLNLLGVFHEIQGHRKRARKFYRLALGVSGRYEPAAINLRRLQELRQRGRTSKAVAMGPEYERSDPISRTRPPSTNP